jgi:hypothetical protein
MRCTWWGTRGYETNAFVVVKEVKEIMQDTQPTSNENRAAGAPIEKLIVLECKHKQVTEESMIR